MKKIILSCVIALTLVSSINASTIASAKKIINVFIEGYVLYATSDAKSGPVQHIDIYDADMGELFITQKCGGSSCQIDLHSLPAGNYEAQVVATKGTLLKAFSL